MPDPIIRLSNVLVMCKAETVEGTDSVPVAGTDDFPFEVESLEIGSPFATESSGEATGSAVASAPIIMGQPVPVKIRFRLKGAGVGVTYTAGVKPPHHALYQACGLRGVFTAAVAATALASGTTTSGTLAAPFAATAQQYRGQRLNLASAPAAGAGALIADYTSGRLATLADVFGSAIGSGNTGAINANWTYAMTSPADNSERLADQPSSTLYVHEDGTLYKLLGFRGALKISADSAKPGFAEVEGTAIWGGQSNTAQPTVTIGAGHAAPTFNMLTAVSPAFLVNRKQLPVSTFSFDWGSPVDTLEDPNTYAGFGAAQIGLSLRNGRLECDPLKTLLATRNHIADLEVPPAVGFTGAVRIGTNSGNRVALTLPRLFPASVEMGKRKGARSESLGFMALNPGRDASGRDGDAILCFD